MPSKERHVRIRARRVRAERNKGLIREAKAGKPCVDCGGVFPPVCMQFDHIPELGSKKLTIARGRHASLKTLLAEIDKCELVCSNCHAIRTEVRRVACSLQ